MLRLKPTFSRLIELFWVIALWFHNVITHEFSIGVNVFWKHLDESFYEKKDVYGNKDLIPFKRAHEFTEKAIKELKHLPADYREFYTKRLIKQLTETCLNVNTK